MEKKLDFIEMSFDFQNNLNLNILRKYSDQLHFPLILEISKLPLNVIEEFVHLLDTHQCWDTLCYHQILNVNFLLKYKEKICWKAYSSNKYLNLEIINMFFDNFDFEILCKYNEKYINENLLDKQNGKFCWKIASEYITMSETFIEKHKNIICWKSISLKYKNLSFGFILRNVSYLDWNIISYYYKFTNDQYDLISNHIVKKNNLLYMTTDELKINVPNIYEIIDDKYVKAYVFLQVFLK